ncbi:NF038122 family metalloprotease, partial [Akkermansiaceae bacterium]|nr:NF038122 family metalloprotease [Akkermansiaceae bacterium]
ALAGFQDAAAIWENFLTDTMVVNLDIRFDGRNFDNSPMAPTTLGSALRVAEVHSYAAVKGALIADTLSANDATATSNLPAGSSLSFLTNDANTSAVITDNNGSGNNNFLDVNRANAKALGLLSGNPADNDASIAFNNSFSWDFDQSDGVGAGLQDFVGVATHEIGHALGFRSGVDAVDATHGAGPSAPTDLNGLAVHTVLDLFRYSAAGQLNYATGGAPYYSIDGGATNLALFSTGSFNGDGRQASHWKDNLAIGLLDPTANPPGQLNLLSQLDIDAIDAIGYDLNLIPEPSSALLALVALGATMRRRRS